MTLDPVHPGVRVPSRTSSRKPPWSFSRSLGFRAQVTIAVTLRLNRRPRPHERLAHNGTRTDQAVTVATGMT